VRIRTPGIVPDTLYDEFIRMAQHLDRVMKIVTSDEEKIELESAAVRCESLAASIRAWLKQELPGQVYWIEGSDERGNRLQLASAPIEVGPHLRQKIFDRVPSVVLTSATLSVGDASGFDFFKERLGFPDDHTLLQLGSPFDYSKQAQLHLFRQMPDPTADPHGFEEACIARIQHYVMETQGRAFVLFTSNQIMQRTANRLRQWLADEGLTLICQGDGMPSNRMLEAFRAAKGAVLFGVDTFWQGVDVQGEALSNVIITKLPFTPPDRPIVEARCEAISERGGQPFLEYSLPQAILKLKQGFGRLIRTRSDKGMVVILDPRMVTKQYGRRFLDGLPECRKFVDGIEVTA
jgi:ATP-dependent DNA helicase DinG